MNGGRSPNVQLQTSQMIEDEARLAISNGQKGQEMYGIVEALAEALSDLGRLL